MNSMEKMLITLRLYCRFYNPNWLHREKTVLQVYLDTPSGNISGYYVFEGDNCTFSTGEFENPDIVFRGHIYDFHDIVNGLAPIDEVSSRPNVSIEGDRELVEMLDKVFTKTIDPIQLGYWEREWSVLDEEWVKPEKVLVINGSGRGKTGITWSFLEPLIEGMKEAGVEVELVNIYDPELKIEPCQGCFVCQAHNPANCILNDDGKKILEKLKNYKLTVFATPVYLFSTPAKLKALLDRMFVELQPFFIQEGEWTRHPLWFKSKRYMALFAISGYPERRIFEPLDTMFEWLARESHSKLIAKIYRSGAWIYKLAPQFEKYYNLIREALKEAGKQLVEEGKIEKELIEKIEKNYIPKEIYYRVNNDFWYRRYKKMGVDPRKIVEELSA